MSRLSKVHKERVRRFVRRHGFEPWFIRHLQVKAKWDTTVNSAMFSMEEIWAAQDYILSTQPNTCTRDELLPDAT